MTPGYSVDTDAMRVAGRAFLDAGQTLTDQGNAVVSDVDSGRTGRAWPGVAGRYQQVVAQFGDKVVDYAVVATQLGNHLGDTAARYDANENSTTDTFTEGS